MVRDAIESGCDGIVLSIIYPTAFENVIDQAQTRGIPMVAFNVNARGTEDGKITRVCRDVYTAGRVLASAVYGHIRPMSTVLVTLHSKGISLENDVGRDGYFCAGFDLSPRIIKFVKEGIVFCTIDQQPYIQGFYPVVQLTHTCRFGLKPADIDSGATLITRENIDVAAGLCDEGYR